MNEPALLTAEYWRTHRCPWCGEAGMFSHMVSHGVLQCDACEVEWDVRYVADHVTRTVMSLVGSLHE